MKAMLIRDIIKNYVSFENGKYTMDIPQMNAISIELEQNFCKPDVGGRSEQLATDVECSEYPHLKCNCIGGNCTNAD